MKKLFIPLIKKQNQKINLNLAKLPNKFSIFYSIQYKKIAEKTKKQLENKTNKKIISFSQVLGCSQISKSIKQKSKNILLIVDGSFHALNLILQGFNVYLYSNNKLTTIDKKQINNLKKLRKSALLKFYHSKPNEKAILVSVKPGQYNLKQAIKLKEKYPNSTIFLTNNINKNEFENFPIKTYINTACPTLIYDSNMFINPEEILD